MLVGRAREQQALDGLLDTARSGHSAVLALVGDAGIGKSVLLAAVGEAAAASGMRVLHARGVQSEAHIPFAGLFELLRPAIGSIDHIPEPQAAALGSALALRPASAQDRFAVGAATLSLLAAYAEAGPIAVLVDDAHWLDGSSADALLFALRRLLADPVGAVLAVREGAPSLLDGADLPTLRLDGLDAAACSELLSTLAAGPLERSVSDRLYRETGGNPLALVELSGERSWQSDSPEDAPLPVGTSVANAYLHRSRSLPAPTQDLLVLAAASDTGEIGLLTRAATTLGLRIGDLAPAEEAGLVSIHDARVEFRHPLARSAIYGAASPDRRRDIHRALAGALPDADVDHRAWHLARAALGPDAAASSALEQAGLRARDRSAYDVASRAFERGARLAIEPAKRDQLLYAAADAAWLGGLADRAVNLLDEARALSPTPELEVSIDLLRGHIATRRGPIQAGQAILLAAADRAASLNDERAAMMLAEALNGALYALDVPAMREAAARVDQLGSAPATGRRAFFTLMTQGMARVFTGDGERGAAAIRDAVSVLERSEELRNDPRLLAWVAMGPLWLREAQAGEALGDGALAAARSRSAVGVLPFLLTHVAWDQAGGDRWGEAEANFYEAIGLARETGQRTELAASLARLSGLEARQGRTQRCHEHATEAMQLAQSLGLGFCEVWTLGALGHLALALGELDEALTRFEAQRDLLVTRGVQDVDLSPGPELVEIYLRLGRSPDAVHSAEQYDRHASAKGQPWAMARAARCRGLVAGEGEADFDAALALHVHTPDVFETGRTHLAYGSSLRRARHRVRAREHLRAALDIFDRLGAEPWGAIARAELAATGETARRRDVTTLDQLTPQELQIALRLADGRTTRETAAALFLSPKTIEYHQRSIYRKLSISSRSELAAAVERLS